MAIGVLEERGVDAVLVDPELCARLGRVRRRVRECGAEHVRTDVDVKQRPDSADDAEPGRNL